MEHLYISCLEPPKWQLAASEHRPINLDSPASGKPESILSGHNIEIVGEPQLLWLVTFSKVHPGGRQSGEIIKLPGLWGWLRQDSQGPIRGSMLWFFFLWHTKVLHSSTQNCNPKDSRRGQKGMVWVHQGGLANGNQKQGPGARLSINSLGTHSKRADFRCNAHSPCPHGLQKLQSSKAQGASVGTTRDGKLCFSRTRQLRRGLGGTSWMTCPINKGQPNENKQRIFIQRGSSELSRREASYVVVRGAYLVVLWWPVLGWKWG